MYRFIFVCYERTHIFLLQAFGFVVALFSSCAWLLVTGCICHFINLFGLPLDGWCCGLPLPLLLLVSGFEFFVQNDLNHQIWVHDISLYVPMSSPSNYFAHILYGLYGYYSGSLLLCVLYDDTTIMLHMRLPYTTYTTFTICIHSFIHFVYGIFKRTMPEMTVSVDYKSACTGYGKNCFLNLVCVCVLYATRMSCVVFELD